MQLRKGRKRKKTAADGWSSFLLLLFYLVCYLPATLLPLSRYNGRVLFRIRQFEKADFDTLWRIDQACFAPQLAYSRPELAFYMRRPGSFTLVAEAEGVPGNRTLGFIVAETRRKSGHIITIDVVAEARRAGVGSALLRAAEDQLLRAGVVGGVGDAGE